MSDASWAQRTCWEPVVDEAQVVRGRAVAVQVSGLPVVVLRCGEDLRALSGICPHDHAPLADAEVRGRRLVCPRHQARFDVDSGVCDPGFVLPALKRYPVRRRNGQVEVDAGAVRRDPPMPGARRRWDLTRPE